MVNAYGQRDAFIGFRVERNRNDRDHEKCLLFGHQQYHCPLPGFQEREERIAKWTFFRRGWWHPKKFSNFGQGLGHIIKLLFNCVLSKRDSLIYNFIRYAFGGKSDGKRRYIPLNKMGICDWKAAAGLLNWNTIDCDKSLYYNLAVFNIGSATMCICMCVLGHKKIIALSQFVIKQSFAYGRVVKQHVHAKWV